MISGKGKWLVLAVVLMLALAPAAADDHLNETEDDSEELEENETEEEDAELEENETEDDSDIDGTDNSTELTVEKAEAERTARSVLSDNEWELDVSSTHEKDGYYRFRFVVSGEDAEAEVRVDGSSGEVFRYEEELEREAGEEVEELEKVEVQNLEQARQRISELRGMVMDLRREVAELKAERSGSEAEIEFKRENGETELEAKKEAGEREAEVEMKGPNKNARENVNGTPGSDQAERNRPGFVSRMLSGFFS